MRNYRIGIDCMGFENSPLEAIKAAICFSRKYSDVQFVFFGQQKYLQFVAKKNNPRWKTVLASDVIEQKETLITARKKVNSSMLVGIDHLKKGEIDALVSAGSSSAFVSFLYVKIGVFAKLSKPAFMPFLPTTNKVGVNLLDVGANISQSEHDLYNLALIGKLYANKIRHIVNPKIAILNIGSESSKGPLVLQNANKLFQQDSKMNYCGFIEPREILSGVVDVIVCDGYAGNLVLKAMEGSLKTVGQLLKTSAKHNPLSLLFSFNLFWKICRIFDYKNNAGAIVVGIKKLAVKTHGSASKKEFYSTIRLTYQSLKSGVMQCLEDIFT